MIMYKVAIVGSGQLASLHLQVLWKIEFLMSKYNVEFLEEFTNLAKSRASEIGLMTNSLDIKFLSLT